MKDFMKKIMAAALLSLSLANISCKEVKNENTPWYTNHKKFFLASCVKSFAFLGANVIRRSLLAARDGRHGSPYERFAECFSTYIQTNVNADYFITTAVSNLIGTVFYVAIFKEIHNRNKKKQKTLGVL